MLLQPMNWLKSLDVDAEKYGLEMLKAGADLSDKTIDQLISLRCKRV